MTKPAREAEHAGSTFDLTTWRPLPREFFDAPPEQVARLLLGKILVRRGRGGPLAGRIVETEAYLGEHDAAAHAASGRTARNAVLYGPPGHAYIYNIYGLYACFNISCLPEGVPGCVLVRALEPLQGIAEMRRNRGLNGSAGIHQLTSGPGKLCQALDISRAEDNGLDLTRADGRLGLVEDNFQCGEIRVTPRVGISRAADWPLRFFLAGHDCVSGRRG
ncbi:MAG TPA: DNA-3-methyladenine glycosylase [Acidobacteriaceae bacterium]|nr:DNA-3-methyladenine glycosylase [Acidobacteriaceae bacterium]